MTKFCNYLTLPEQVRFNDKIDESQSHTDSKFPGLRFDKNNNIIFHKPSGFFAWDREQKFFKNPEVIMKKDV